MIYLPNTPTAKTTIPTANTFIIEFSALSIVTLAVCAVQVKFQIPTPVILPICIITGFSLGTLFDEINTLYPNFFPKIQKANIIKKQPETN
jgi:hypothetical protein